jgi:hypothetical protein
MRATYEVDLTRFAAREKIVRPGMGGSPRARSPLFSESASEPHRGEEIRVGLRYRGRDGGRGRARSRRPVGKERSVESSDAESMTARDQPSRLSAASSRRSTSYLATSFSRGTPWAWGENLFGLRRHLRAYQPHGHWALESSRERHLCISTSPSFTLGLMMASAVPISPNAAKIRRPSPRCQGDRSSPAPPHLSTSALPNEASWSSSVP